MQRQVALITGGGSGIGRATAKLLASCGANIAITEIPGRKGLIDSLLLELQGVGVQAMGLTLDLRETMTIEATIRQVYKHFGRLDILVNNAGVQLLKPALDIEESEYDEILTVNLKGPFLCSQVAGDIMIRQHSGCIINIASQHGIVGNKLRAPYCASKGGLISLTKALAIEWAEFGIRVNSISPTFVVNERNQALLSSEILRQDVEQIPLGSCATVDDIAAGVLYLASPMARMVTGHNLIIDGGWTAK